MNGDVAGVTFPSTPESPSSGGGGGTIQQLPPTSPPDYSSLNGAAIPSEVLFSTSDTGAYTTGVIQSKKLNKTLGHIVSRLAAPTGVENGNQHSQSVVSFGGGEKKIFG